MGDPSNGGRQYRRSIIVALRARQAGIEAASASAKAGSQFLLVKIRIDRDRIMFRQGPGRNVATDSRSGHRDPHFCHSVAPFETRGAIPGVSNRAHARDACKNLRILTLKQGESPMKSS